MIYEKNGLVITHYNVLITQLKSKVVSIFLTMAKGMCQNLQR
jgi:hypothetical protein